MKCGNFVSVSAQNSPSLICFECADCRTVDRATTNRTQCYGPATVPTRQTHPATSKLTTNFFNFVNWNFIFCYQSGLRQQHNSPQACQQQWQQLQHQKFKKVLSVTMKFSQLDVLQFTRATQSRETVSWAEAFCQLNSSLFLVGDRRLTSRGCAIVHPRKEETCRFHNQGEEPQSCTLCDEHDCNVTDGVGKLFASISLIFALLFIAVRLH